MFRRNSDDAHHSPLYNRVFRAIDYPDDTDAVTSIDPDGVDPLKVGLEPDAVEEIWESVRGMYTSGVHPGVSFCLRRHGEIAIHRSIGYASGLDAAEESEPEPMTLNTPVCLFSASKEVTAMVAHKLAEEGYINLLDPICYYIPQFAQKGKGHITIYQLLSHRGSVPRVDGDRDVENVFEHKAMLDLICEAEPSCTDGRVTEYHAITGGFIVAELVKITTGKTIRQYLDEKFRKPMGMRYFDYGIRGRDLNRSAVNYITGLPNARLIKNVLEKAFGAEIDAATTMSNTDEFKKAVIPSANMYATAEEASRFFQMMLDHGQWQGEQILDPLTVFRSTRETSTATIDRNVKLPMRYSSGFMLGGNPIGIYGKECHHAYGHIGFSNVFCWADPQRDIAVSLMTTGKPVLGPHVLTLPKMMYRISTLCEPTRDMVGSEPVFAGKVK